MRRFVAGPLPALSTALVAASVALALGGATVRARADAPGHGTARFQRALAEDPFEVVGELGGPVTGLAASGNRAFVGIGNRIASVVATSPESQPRLEGISLPVPDAVADVAALSGSEVLVAAGRALYVVDPTDRSGRLPAQVYVIDDTILKLEVANRTAYALTANRVEVIDLALVESPRLRSRYDLPFEASSRSTRMVAGDGLLFLGHINAVLVIDVSTPDRPALLGGIEDGVTVDRMAASGRRLYVLDDRIERDAEDWPLFGVIVYVVDVGIDGRIVNHGPVALVTPARQPDFQATEMVATGSLLCIDGTASPHLDGNDQRVRCWNMSQPRAAIQTCDTPVRGMGYPVASAASDNRFFFAANDAQLRPGGYQSPAIGTGVYDGEGRLMWAGYWQLDQPGSPHLVESSDVTVVLQEWAGHTQVYRGPTVVGSVPVGSIPLGAAPPATELRVMDSRLYAVGLAGVTAIDLSDPTRPQVGAHTEVTNTLPLIAAADDLVLVGQRIEKPREGEEPGSSIVVVETSADGVSSLRVVARVPVGDYVRSLYVADGRAYVVRVADWSSNESIAVVDLSEPAAPVLLGAFSPAPGIRAKNAVVRRGLAYVAFRSGESPRDGSDCGLAVVDVGKPEDSRVIGIERGRCEAPDVDHWTSQDYEMVVVDDYVLHTCDDGILRVVSVRDPTRPQLVQTIQVPTKITDLAASRGSVHVVTQDRHFVGIRQRDGGPEPPGTAPLFLPWARGW